MKLPYTPAHKGAKPIDKSGRALLDVGFCRAVLAVLVMRNGGPIAVSQADLDGVTGLALMEGHNMGQFMIGLGVRVPGEGEVQ